MAEDNPITMVYKALQELAMSSVEFAALVSENNVIKYIDGTRDPVKHRASPADFPALCLIPVGGIGMTHMSNSHGQLLKTFQWLIATGDKRADYAMFDVEWELLRAMHDWQESLESLTWSGEHFVKGCTLDKADETQSETLLSRDDSGWSCLWSGTVTMVFPKTLLVPTRSA